MHWFKSINHALAGDFFFNQKGGSATPPPAPPAAPVATAATLVSYYSFSANWIISIGADGYYLDVSTDPLFGSFVPGYENLDVLNVLTYSVTGLLPNVQYYFRVRAYNGDGTSTNSNTETTTTLYNIQADPNALLWANPQRNVTTEGDPAELTNWLDVISGQPVNPPTVTARPLYGTDQINGLDVLTFRSADPNYLDIDTTTWGSNITLYFVLNITTSNQRRQLFANSIGTTTRCRIDNDGAGTSMSGFGTLIEVRRNNVLAYVDPNETEMDNVLIGNGVISISKLDFTGINTLRIGASSSINQGIDGIIADIAATQGATNLTENNNFLMTEYGLS